jgi:signal transduction histidine kinase
MSQLQKSINNLLSAGVSSFQKDSIVRSIKISNLVIFGAVFNTLIFGMIFFLRGDEHYQNICLIVSAVYSLSYVLNYFNYTKTGRSLAILSGNLVIFYFAGVFRGSIDIELLFLSLAVVPLMFFSLEEKAGYTLILLSITLFIFGEYHSWQLFDAYIYSYDPKWFRIFSILATSNQLLVGFYYFLLQSSKYELESKSNLLKLENEYRKQLQVQKMSSLGEMAAGISHEINNPLMVVLGKTYQIKRKLDQSRLEILKDVEKIEEMAHRMSKIVRALKSFSRNADQDPVETTNLSNIIELTLDLCQEKFYISGIKLRLDVEENLFISCRPTEISQVLLNLLNNAFDAVHSVKNPEVMIKSLRNGNSIEIQVLDNGEGIPLEIQDKIMSPFFTTKEIGKGTGLGLSISKGIIESHQGTLLLIQNMEKTCFQILIPATVDS